MLGFCSTLLLPTQQLSSTLNLAHFMASMISKKWPTALNLVMVGSFAMNTPSNCNPLIDLLLVPSDISGAEGFMAGVPCAADILVHLTEVRVPNVKHEYTETDDEIRNRSIGQADDVRFDGSVDFEKSCIKFVSQQEHQDCVELVFCDSSFPEVKGRLFVPSQVGPTYLNRKLTRFQAGAHHATWVRLISGEEIQVGVMHTLLLMRYLR